MAASPRSPRVVLALGALVLSLVGGSLGLATTGAAASREPAPPLAAGPIGTGAVEAVRSIPATPLGSLDSRGELARERASVQRPVGAATLAWAARSAAPAPAPKPKSESTATAKSRSTSTSSAPLTGRNKVWIPSLGIRRSVSFFSCSSSAYPGNRVYRWGCAGANNVYLFGHAHSVFKPLHDAYVRGRLHRGMKVYYADSRGRVSTYKVIWWKTTTPDKGAWAYASQRRPSMTLQTCVGARSQYRLIVRLVRV